MSSDDGVQWVSTAWINALRDEALRVRMPEVARVVGVGVWIATFADKDGTNAFPSRETLATLAGCSQETVTRAVKVLMGVGVLQRKRRPNTSAVYQLLMPLGGALNWSAHIHHMTETRQRKAYAKKKAEAFAEERTASTDAVRTATTDRVPDSVRGGGSEPFEATPDSVHGRPRTASVDALRTASTDAPTKPTPTSGRDPHTDHNMAGLSPQPQQRAGEAAEEDDSSRGEGPQGTPTPQAAERGEQPAPAFGRCRECEIPLIRPGRALCHGCEQYLAKHATTHGRHTA
ncbi:helix-turn-helix domain-containing protein [Streptomyces sp. NPDC014889]|uniref:helix-turn-helix domain-containing protein n=1 Tax=Streptomyces sp. NPDC014889 TaxID=3364928 RepID=UPI0036FC323E